MRSTPSASAAKSATAQDATKPSLPQIAGDAEGISGDEIGSDSYSHYEPGFQCTNSHGHLVEGLRETITVETSSFSFQSDVCATTASQIYSGDITSSATIRVLGFQENIYDGAHGTAPSLLLPTAGYREAWCHVMKTATDDRDADILVTARAGSKELTANVVLSVPGTPSARSYIGPFAITRGGDATTRRYDSTYAFTLSIDMRAVAKQKYESPGTVDATVDGKELKANVTCRVR